MMSDKDIFVHEFNGLLGKRLLEHLTLSHALNIDCERQLLGQLNEAVGPLLANMPLVSCECDVEHVYCSNHTPKRICPR